MSLLLDALKKAEEAKRRKLEAEGSSASPSGSQAQPNDTNAGPEPAPLAAPALELESPSATDFPSLAQSPEPESAPAIEPAPLEFTADLGESVQEMPLLAFDPPQVASNETPTQADSAAAPTPPVLSFDLLTPDTSTPTTEPASIHEIAPAIPAIAAQETPQAPAPIKETTSTMAQAAARLSGRTGKNVSSEPLPIEPETAPPPSRATSTTAAVASHAQPAKAAEPTTAPAAEPSPIRAEPRTANNTPEAARNLFDSKQATKRRMPRTSLLLLIACVVLAVGLWGGWFWWQTHAHLSSSVLVAQPQTAQPLPAQPTAPQAAPAPATPSQASAPAANTPTAQPAPRPDSPMAVTPTGTSIASNELATETPEPVKLAHARAQDRAKIVEVPPDIASTDVHFVRSRDTANVPASVQKGYDAYQRGDYAAAATSYQQQLAQDPNNRDALLGLAAIALQHHQNDIARGYYAQVLNLDPSDQTATAAMATLSANGDSEGAEAKLSRAFQNNPAPETASALGNLLARQQRWREAQEYYFKAYSAAPSEPDYAFNLAVSLDALGQGKLATEYYERALALGSNHAANFDRAAAQRRVAELHGP